MKKKILIIGSGVAGLSAGIFGQINGFETEIYEKHKIAGGLCTSWVRKNFRFDGCIHWLVGSSNKNDYFYNLWQTLGVLDNTDFYNHTIFKTIEINQKEYKIYTNLEQLKRHLLQYFPEDIKSINHFIKQVKKCTKVVLPSNKLNIFQRSFYLLQALPGLFFIWQHREMTINQYSEKFTNPILKEIINNIIDISDLPVYVLFMVLAWFSSNNADYPIGGSNALIDRMLKRYLSLGGKIFYENEVKEILITDDTAIGIKLFNDNEIRGDLIVSAGDGYNTIFEILNGKYIDEIISAYYQEIPVFASIIMLNLGIKADLAKYSWMRTIKLNRPILFNGKNIPFLSVRHFCYDPTLSEKHTSVLQIILEDDFSFWEKLRKDPVLYKAEKIKLSSLIIPELEKFYPEIKGNIEVIDVATPITFKRYTNNWQGSMEGWKPTIFNFKELAHGLKITLPNLANFYMCGQWTFIGGGLPASAQSGQKIITKICQDINKEFIF